MTIMIGIDPHKASHTAVAIDSNEHVLDELRVRSSATQADRLRCWAAGFENRTWAVESAQGLGYLLAQQLVAAGEVVLDVPAVRASRVRTLSSGRSQKNDPNDARSVAIAALRADDLAEVRADDHARILRLLVKRHRDLGRAKNQACCRLHALLLEMVPGGAGFRMVSVTRANTLIDSFEPINATGPQRLEVARELVTEIAHYDDRSPERYACLFGPRAFVLCGAWTWRMVSWTRFWRRRWVCRGSRSSRPADLASGAGRRRHR